MIYPLFFLQSGSDRRLQSFPCFRRCREGNHWWPGTRDRRPCPGSSHQLDRVGIHHPEVETEQRRVHSVSLHHQISRLGDLTCTTGRFVYVRTVRTFVESVVDVTEKQSCLSINRLIQSIFFLNKCIISRTKL